MRAFWGSPYKRPWVHGFEAPTRELFLKEHALLSRTCVSLDPLETLQRFEGVFMSWIMFDKRFAGCEVHNEGQEADIDMPNLKRHRAAQGC